jgi:hypothetical protein
VYNVGGAEEQAILHGKALQLPDAAPGDKGLIALKGPRGGLLAIAEWDGESGLWQPRKVFGAGR